MKRFYLPTFALWLSVPFYFALSSIGPAMWPDSAGYLSVARSLADGNGITRFDGREQIEQPPLYPAVLAAMSFVSGRDPLQVVWFDQYLRSRGFYTPDEIAKIALISYSEKYKDGQIIEVERLP